jgi:hypothetical protein
MPTDRSASALEIAETFVRIGPVDVTSVVYSKRTFGV